MTSRYIYLLMSSLFVVTAIVGFAPTSLELISKVTSGQQPFPPFILHFHAASMSLWLLLLLAQSVIMYRGKPNIHKKLGLISFVLAPCILVSMYGVEMLNIGRNVVSGSDISPNQSAQYMRNISSSLLIHGASYLFFPVFYLWAILVRLKDGETHKRMMILATLVLMIPAIGRLLSVSRLLPDLGFNVIDARHFYLVLLIVPAVVYDVVKQGIPHKSYIIGIFLILVWIVTAHFLWNSPWWIETAPGLMGVSYW